MYMRSKSNPSVSDCGTASVIATQAQKGVNVSIERMHVKMFFSDVTVFCRRGKA